MTRLVSGVVLAAAALAAILFLPADILRYVVIGIALLTASEYMAIARRTNIAPTPWIVFGLVAVACWWISFSNDRPGPMYPVLMLALALLVVDVLFLGKSLSDSAVALLAPLYIGLPLGMLVAIHALGGREAVILLIATIVVSDSSQYYTGRLFGRHALAPTVSPKKTIEGAIKPSKGRLAASCSARPSSSSPAASCFRWRGAPCCWRWARRSCCSASPGTCSNRS
jgi:phosphatidate cytidylyltransferase